MPVTPHLGTLRNARHFLQIARTLGYPDDRMQFVLNRATNLAGLSPDDIATLLGARTFHQIPSGGAEVSRAANTGRPLVLHQPKSTVGKALLALGDQVRHRVAS